MNECSIREDKDPEKDKEKKKRSRTIIDIIKDGTSLFSLEQQIESLSEEEKTRLLSALEDDKKQNP